MDLLYISDWPSTGWWCYVTRGRYLSSLQWLAKSPWLVTSYTCFFYSGWSDYTWLMTSYPCDGHIQTAGRGGKKKGGGTSPSAGHCQGSADGGELIRFFLKRRWTGTRLIWVTIVSNKPLSGIWWSSFTTEEIPINLETMLKGTHARDFIVRFSHFFGIIQ